MKYVNICVLNINEGGDVYVEEKMNDMFLEVFLSEWSVGDDVGLEEGLSELDDYYFNNGNGMDNDKELNKEWGKVKDEFRRKVNGREGRFYLWGVEYDYDLLFIEEDSLEEFENLEFVEDEYGEVSIKS